MVELIDRKRSYYALDVVEIDDHSARGTVGLNRAANRDLEPIRMPVHAGAFSQVKRQRMRRLKRKVLANLQCAAGYSVPSGPIASRRRFKSAKKPLAT